MSRKGHLCPTGKADEGRAGLQPSPLQPLSLSHTNCITAAEREKMWAPVAETLAAHHCLQLEFLLPAFTNDNPGQE